MKATPAVFRVADFEAAWYLSLLIFAIIMLVVAGVVLGQGPVRRMWRAGDYGLSVLVASVVFVTGLFFLLLFLVTVVAIFPRTGLV
jgi:hypothetical protein